MNQERGSFKCGFVALVGRPNVGKSTLLNALVGKKIAIISPRPQTTRNIIRGIVTFKEAQIIFVDTPGIAELASAKTPLDRYIVEEALASIDGVDLIIFMTEPSPPARKDKFLLEHLKKVEKPVFLVINKSDKSKEGYIFALMEEYREIFPFQKMIPVSAKKGTNLSILVGEMINALPPGKPYYPRDLVTDQPEELILGEIIREKVFALTRQEVPYSTLIKIEEISERKGRNLTYIRASIYVEESSQRGILVGKGGRMIKEIGKLAREEIEKRLGTRVYLELRVGVKRHWRRKKESLQELGYS